MPRLVSMEELFKGRHFDQEIVISVCPVVSQLLTELSRPCGRDE